MIALVSLLIPISVLPFLPASQYQWALALLILCALLPWLSAFMSGTRAPDPVSPVTLVVLLFMLYYLTYPLVVLLVADENLLLEKMVDGGYSIVLASSIGALALLLFFLGYYLFSTGKENSVQILHRKLSPNLLFISSGLLILIGLINFKVGLPVYVFWLPAYVLLCVGLATKGMFSRSWGSLRFFAVLLLVLLVYLSVNDERRELAALLIAAGVMYAYMVKPIRYTHMVLAIPLALIAAFGVGVKRGGKDFQLSMLNAFGDPAVIDYTLRQVDVGVVYPDLAQLYTDVPDSVPLLYGQTLSKPFFWIIPRSIWPNKPETVSRLFAKIFDPHYYSVGGSRPPTVVGELYWNFHIWGVAIGFFFIGLMARRISMEFCHKLTRMPEKIGFSALVLSQAVSLFRGSIATGMLSLIVILIAYICAIEFSAMRRRITKLG